MVYSPTILNNLFDVVNLYTIHYFEYTKNFVFDGERHDFWEFLYVDKGRIEIVADKNSLILCKDDIIFHKPNEFHSLCADGQVAPNIMVISFSINSEKMKFFENKIFKVDSEMKKTLSNIMKEAKYAFSSNLSDFKLKKLEKQNNSLAGCEQLIKIYLEELLIKLYRYFSLDDAVVYKDPYFKNNIDTNYLKIVRYLENHIGEKITVEKISHDNFLSCSQLQKIFKQKTGNGVIDYFIKLKIDFAKQLIREGHNFTEISYQLGYSSLHYFSKQFKIYTGMSPTEYLLSVV